MPLYDFRCEEGHLTEKFYRMSDNRPESVECDWCGEPARRSFSSPPTIINDFPEHFNVSMGRVVKNRAHHKQLQRELGCQDWEPTRDSPGSQLTRDRARRAGRSNF